jgi:acetyltransferase-like isoleucine patch superfamily enzyme
VLGVFAGSPKRDQKFSRRGAQHAKEDLNRNFAMERLDRMSYVSRVRAAQQRYGSRAFTVLLYRALFQWPRLRARAIQLKLKLLLGAKISSTVSLGKHVFVTIPGGLLMIGDQTWIGDRCVIEVSPSPWAEVRIGSNSYFAHDVHIGAFQQISIGNSVRVAEFTSLRDSSHNYIDGNQQIIQQGDSLGTLSIEDDVWIGQGCIILGSPAGTVIGKGAVIGAHSVVKESIPEYAIAVGSPARVVGYRETRKHERS